MNPAVLVVLATTLLANLDHAWFGRWVLNRDVSHLTGDSLDITAVPSGGAFDVRSFTIDEPPPQTPASHAMTLQQAADGSWVLQSRLQNQVVMHGRVTLTPDQRRMDIVTVADGGPAAGQSGSEVYDRVGAGSGPAGVWRSRESEFGVGDVIDLQLAAGGRIRWAMPNDQQFYLVRPGGPAAPYQGAKGDPSLTVALQIVSPREMRWTEFVSGHRDVEATDSLSSDGTWLTEVSWQLDNPAIRQIAVYQRR